MSHKLPDKRTFYLGFVPGTMVKGPEALEAVYKTIDEHADMVALHDMIDIPWPEALAEKPYPNELEDAIARLKSSLKKNHKDHTVYLAVEPLTLMRDKLNEGSGDWQDKGPFL